MMEVISMLPAEEEAKYKFTSVDRDNNSRYSIMAAILS